MDDDWLWAASAVQALILLALLRTLSLPELAALHAQCKAELD